MVRGEVKHGLWFAALLELFGCQHFDEIHRAAQPKFEIIKTFSNFWAMVLTTTMASGLEGVAIYYYVGKISRCNAGNSKLGLELSLNLTRVSMWRLLISLQLKGRNSINNWNPKNYFFYLFLFLTEKNIMPKRNLSSAFF